MPKNKMLRLDLETAKAVSKKAAGKNKAKQQTSVSAAEYLTSQKLAESSQLEDDLNALLKIHNIKGFDREVTFHPKRKWRFDFANGFLLIAIECEGIVGDGKGRHQTAKGFSEDCQKYNEAAVLGWLVLRFTKSQIASGEAVRLTKEACSLRQAQVFKNI